MKVRIICFVFIVGLILLTSTLVDGGRGGGSRGGGRRGSSSRGSSSRGSNRGTSSTSTSNRERYNQKKSDDTSESKPSVPVPAPKVPEPTRVKPSAPELKETRPEPSAPRLPSESNQSPYNPNYGQGSKTQPGINPAQIQPHPGSNTGQHPGAPPSYPGSNTGQSPGAPPPYPGSNAGQPVGVPPPYPGPSQPRPPPYDTQPLPPEPGFKPGTGTQTFPQQSGAANPPYPQQPGMGNQPYPRQPGVGNQPYPQQPGTGNQPYPRQPGTGAQPYPHQTNMNQPYPRQPGAAPYPQQPGGIHGPPPPYVQNSGLPIGGNSYTKPYKKKGLLGQIFSFNKGGSKAPKPPKYGSYGSGYGGGYGGGHAGIPKAMYPMMPMMMMAKKPKFSPSLGLGLGLGSSLLFLPFFMPSFHHHHGGHYYDINNPRYRGGCRKPLKPLNSTMDCDFTTRGASCRVQCNEGYAFSENVTIKESTCWHSGGVWRPSKNFSQCLPICKEKCLNGGKCREPGETCFCKAEYRGENCEHYVLNCNIIKFAGENSRKLSWVCQHTRNETICKVNCRPDNHFSEEPQSREYRCSINGTWTPDVIPACIQDENTTLVSLPTK